MFESMSVYVVTHDNEYYVLYYEWTAYVFDKIHNEKATSKTYHKKEKIIIK